MYTHIHTCPAHVLPCLTGHHALVELFVIASSDGLDDLSVGLVPGHALHPLGDGRGVRCLGKSFATLHDEDHQEFHQPHHIQC